MRIVFYITNHGYGHASRNVPIIIRLMELYKNANIIIKSDQERCEFLQRNLKDQRDIIYCPECGEVGLILKAGTLEPDLDELKKEIYKDVCRWSEYIFREKRFLELFCPDLIIADIIGWPLICAKELGIKSVLIGNFTWASMYKSFFEQSIYKPYLECYEKADVAIWYELHTKELDDYRTTVRQVSLLSRKIHAEEIVSIRSKHLRPIVFVSLGASAEVNAWIDVSMLPYDFIITRGLNFKGDNVYHLPDDTINTQDYIAASEFVIAKGGWSTVSEILLQHKKCCLLRRGINSEDEEVRCVLERRQHCVSIEEKDLHNIAILIERMKALSPMSYDYYDSTEEICKIISEAMEMKEEI